MGGDKTVQWLLVYIIYTEDFVTLPKGLKPKQ